MSKLTVQLFFTTTIGFYPVRAEALFPAIVKTEFGTIGMPWVWEYDSQDWAKE